MSEIEKMDENDEEFKKKKSQLKVNVETKAQLLKIIGLATTHQSMKTDLEDKINQQIVQHVLKVDFEKNLLVVCKNHIRFGIAN